MDGLLLYLLLGMFAGTVAGLLGVGGGLIIVPVLVFVFSEQSMSAAVIVHMAVGTSLASIVMTSISSVYAHHKHDAVIWPVFMQLAPGIVVGAFVGAAVADVLPAELLKNIFGVFELLVATQMLLAAKPVAHRKLPGRVGMSLAGVLIGKVSAIIGIGGGTMTVPYLVWCNVPVHKAVATSSACGLPIAIAGAAGFIMLGWNETGLPTASSGYVYWPAWLGIVAASVLFAPLGARLAHTLPVNALKRMFALLLVFLGVRMLMF